MQPLVHTGRLAAAQPRPRPLRSPQEAARIRVQNRRLEYLRRHPSFVVSGDREFADVKLYDELVRAFQTPAERSAEARDKGFGQVLEASMLRNPERLQRVGDEEEEEGEEEDEEGEDGEKEEEGEKENGKETKRHAGQKQAFYEDLDLGAASDRDAAGQRWQAFVRGWFVAGGAADDGFDYVAVDEDSDYDVLARADAEEAWFDDETPEWAVGGEQRAGETGMQDF